jgi:hypothetical protein
MLLRSRYLPDAFLSDLRLEVESSTDTATQRRESRRAPILTVPEPGSFYQIQAGNDNLLTTAGRAYGVGPGGERLRYAQRISSHPFNRTLLVPPHNTFELKYFPSSVVSFLPRFTCTVPQRRAGGRERRCFGIIWIPPRDGSGPFDPAVTFLAPAQSGSIDRAVQTLLTALGSGPFCKRLFLDLMVGEDDRVRVDDDRRLHAPFRWACKVLAIFPVNSAGRRPIAQASGVLLSPSRLATNAHVLDTDLGVPDALLVIPGFSKAEPPEVTELDDHSAPFGAWLVQRRKPGGDSNFHIAPEFRRLGDYAADYAVVDLAGARSVGGLAGAPQDGWLTVDHRLALSAPQAANPAGEDATIQGSNPVPTRKLLRHLGASKLLAAGYPADRNCEMMLATDRVRPLEELRHWVERGRPRSGHVYPDTDNHAKVGSRLDTTFGNSGSPVWVERLVWRREGSKRIKRRQFILAGLLQGGQHHVTERIDFRAPTWQRVVYAPPPEMGGGIHTSSEVVVLTPFVLQRLWRPSLMLPA